MTPWGVVRRPRRAPVGSVFRTSKRNSSYYRRAPSGARARVSLAGRRDIATFHGKGHGNAVPLDDALFNIDRQHRNRSDQGFD